MKKETRIRHLNKAINLITDRIDGWMKDEPELAKANEILCNLLEDMKKEVDKPR